MNHSWIWNLKDHQQKSCCCREKRSGDLLAKQECKCFIWGNLSWNNSSEKFWQSKLSLLRQTIKIKAFLHKWWRAFKQNNHKTMQPKTPKNSCKPADFRNSLQTSGQVLIHWMLVSLRAVLLFNYFMSILPLILRRIRHVSVQSCLLIIFQYQPISLQYPWLSVEQPIRFQLSLVYASLGISNTIEDNCNVNMP